MFVALLALWSCGQTIDCSNPETTIAEAGERSLTCHEAGWAIGWIELLAARPVSPGDRRLAYEALKSSFLADPGGTEAWLESLRVAGAELSLQEGLAGAEARATSVWRASEGRGLLSGASEELRAIQKRTLAVWSSDAEEELALAEADIEGWIRYGSLCREAQQGGALRISVADRVSVYRMIQERFDAGTRSEQIALSSMGPAWKRVPNAWRLASYHQQQTWIQAAPLPPPMTATSLGYAQALFDGDVTAHAAALHQELGPFTVGSRGPMFKPEAPSP
ncbi:MAG TPA: hypothetical protein ENK18_27890 [Deltaproteobacteria bacterium]|nr:hypothetical protein [Deltaproteobacteria bacterium]